MGPQRCVAGLALAFLLTACATPAPDPEPQVAEPQDTRVESLLEMVNAELAANPGTAPKGLQISVTNVDDTGEQLVFDILFSAPEARARDAEEFVVYVSCGRNQLADCSRKLVDAARTLKRR